MEELNINNSKSDLIIKELLENLEKQKSDLKMLHEQILSNNAQAEQTMLELRQKVNEKIKELEEALSNANSLLQNKEKEIEESRLQEIEALKVRENKIAELQEIIQKQKTEYEDLQAQYANDMACQELVIEQLKKESESQKAEIQRLKKIERILTFIKYRSLRAYITSAGALKLRSWAALKFLWFTTKLLDRYNEKYKFFTQDELAIIFPKKYKKIPVMKIKIPPTEEKKKKLRDWKRIWRWKKKEE